MRVGLLHMRNHGKWVASGVVIAIVWLAMGACGGDGPSPESDTRRAATEASQASAEADAVQQAFRAYFLPASANDGAATADHVSSTSVAYYGELRDLALYGPEEAVFERPTFDQMQIWRLRQSHGAEELLAMDPRDVLVWAIDLDIVGDGVRQASELREIVVNGDTATGLHYIGGQRVLYHPPFRLVREEGRWRFDLIPVIEAKERDMDRLAEQSPYTKSELAYRITELSSGAKLAPEHFEPLVSK